LYLNPFHADEIFTEHLLQIHFAVLLFGGAGLFVKFIALSPLFITFARVFFAAISLFIVLFIQKKPYQSKSIINYFRLLLPGFLLAFHWYCFFKSISLSTVAIGLLTYSTFPVFVIFLEPLFFREKLHLSSLFFAFMALLGIFLIVPEFDLHNNTTQAVIYGLLSGLSFAFLSIFNRKLVQDFAAIEIAFFQNLAAFICLIASGDLIITDHHRKGYFITGLTGYYFYRIGPQSVYKRNAKNKGPDCRNYCHPGTCLWYCAGFLSA